MTRSWNDPIESLPKADDTGLFRKYCTTTGWGRLQLGGPRSAVLLATTTRISSLWENSRSFFPVLKYIQIRASRDICFFVLFELEKELWVRTQTNTGAGVVTMLVWQSIYVHLDPIIKVSVKVIVADHCFAITKIKNRFYSVWPLSEVTVAVA